MQVPIHLGNLGRRFKAMTIIENKEEVLLAANKGGFGIATHAGLHHADEIFAVALLQHSSLKASISWVQELDQRACPNVEAVAKAISTTEPVLVLDMAGSRYDHHGPAQGLAMDGDRKLSACGLIWRDFAEEVLQTSPASSRARLEEIRNTLDDLVEGIDAHDTGATCGFGYIYNVLAKTNRWDFAQSLNWAGKVLDSLLSPSGAEADPCWGDGRISLYPRMVSAIWGKGFSALVALSSELQREIFSTCLSYEEAEKKAHEAIAKELLSLPRQIATSASNNEVCYVVTDRFIPMDVKEYSDVLAEGIQLVVNKEVDPRTKELTGLWQFRALANCGSTIMKTGVTAGQIDGVVFIHPSGYTGKFSTLEDLAKCIKD